MTTPRDFKIADMELSRLGLGGWVIAGSNWRYGWGEQDDQDSIATIRHAFENGVNWIDGAAIGGLGHGEEILAEAVSVYSDDDRPFVFTKVGLIPDPNDPSASPVRNMNRASIRRQVEDSLRRLKTERIDNYQVHFPGEEGGPLEAGSEGDRAIGRVGSEEVEIIPGVLVEDYWGYLAELRDEGKVRAIGLANHSAAQLERCSRVAHVDSMQPPFSPIVRATVEEIDMSVKVDTPCTIYSPMQSGLLTGSFTKERAAALPPNDWRKYHADFTVNLDKNLALADALRPIAERYGVMVGQVAIAWTLGWPGVAGALVGARIPAQLDGWVAAADLKLTDEDYDEVATAIERIGVGSGPLRPPLS